MVYVSGVAVLLLLLQDSHCSTQLHVQEPTFLQRCATCLLAAATVAMPMSVSPVLVRAGHRQQTLDPRQQQRSHSIRMCMLAAAATGCVQGAAVATAPAWHCGIGTSSAETPSARPHVIRQAPSDSSHGCQPPGRPLSEALR